MGKKRKSNKHLPPRVYVHGKCYRYIRRDGKAIPLGQTIHEAFANYAKLVELPVKIITLNQVIDKYLKEEAPLKSPRTYDDRIKESIKVRVALGDMNVEDISTPIVCEFLKIRADQSGNVRSNKERAFLSHVFNCARRWGITRYNPVASTQKQKEPKRDREVTDEELRIILKLAPPSLRLLIEFSYLTGLRQGDILDLKWSNCIEEGIKVNNKKTGVKQLFIWTPRLQEIIKQVKKRKLNHPSLYIFTNTKNEPYTSDGFRHRWQYVMNKALRLNLLKERFRFHDLRHKAATDKLKESDLEKARQLLGHSSQKMTSQYLNGYRSVEPLNKKILPNQNNITNIKTKRNLTN